jgi:hypothetical protein
MPLTFPHRDRFVDPYAGLSFMGSDEANRRVPCHVQIAALRDHFALEQGATGHILAVFDENRAAIEAVAARKFAQGEIVPGRGIVLSSEDFQ